ncbi:HigA family addiction module antitoxin [Zavarzinia sp. CC-PAN008]|uniref:HigA family addiction module antitoxin n=1 Tax=Zavarzinia sp. CC-PAN008 TaxID=3243332 RepID=UPI003F749BCE
MAAKTKKQVTDTPAHPGRAIVEEVLGPLALTQEQLAKLTRVSRRTINQLVNRRRNLTADMALRIARVTGSDARTWMERQVDWDLWQAARDGAGVLSELAPIAAANAAQPAADVAPPADLLPVRKPKKDKAAKKAKGRKTDKKKKK